MDKAIIESKLDLLYEFIKNNLNKSEDFSVGTGSASASLFFHEYNNLFNKDESHVLSIQEFEKSYNNIENNLSNTGFINGITGVVWLYDYFVEKDLVEGDESIFDFFDSFLLESIELEKINNNYDLFYGLIGYGCYFLERAAKDDTYYPVLNKIVDSLESLSSQDENGIYWINQRDKNINLGMAHGIPSILSFLAEVYDLTKYEKAQSMGEKTVSWMLNHKTDSSEAFCIFPSSISIDFLRPFNTSRLAWCYGDLGIGYSFIKFGKCVSNDEILNEGINIIRKTTARKIENEGTGIKDMGFCHGIAGLVYIYHKLIINYNLIEFNDIRNYWINELCKGKDIEFYYAYVNYSKEITYAPDIGLIGGMAGIGLTLMSCLNNEAGRWDKSFLL